MTLVDLLTNFILTKSTEPLNEKIVQKAKVFFKDCFACAIAGQYEPGPQIAVNYCRSFGGRPIATMLGANGEKTDPCSAAMVNGTAAHVHDYDDVSTTLTGHPSVAVMPAVLALGEARNSTGAAVLKGYIIGVEVMGLLAKGLNPAHYSKGWHNTGTLGVFGATAAAATLANLNKTQMSNALGVAASRSAGLKGNFGTMTKALHAGLAASNGIFAVEMAQRGFTANKSIMEGEGGFVQTTTGSLDVDAIRDSLRNERSEFLHPGLAMKPYPSCKATHNAIDAVLELRQKSGISVSDICSIEVLVQPIAKDLLKYPQAKTPLEGKFSMNYCLACALYQGYVRLADFEGDKIENPEILNLMSKIDMRLDDSIAQGEFYNGTWETGVVINLINGQRFSKQVRYALGDPENLMNDEQVNAKFYDCVTRNVNPAKAKELQIMLDKINELDSIRVLMNSLL